MIPTPDTQVNKRQRSDRTRVTLEAQLDEPRTRACAWCGNVFVIYNELGRFCRNGGKCRSRYEARRRREYRYRYNKTWKVKLAAERPKTKAKYDAHAAALKRQQRADRRTAGLCVACGAPAIAGRRMCARHRDRARELNRTYKRRAR